MSFQRTVQFFLAALLSAAATSVSAIELTGVTNAHDPSALVKDGDTYFYFTTGTGIWYNTSTNLTHWGNSDTVFAPGEYPSWIAEEVPENSGNDFWAPDAIKMGDYYYVYYSVSTFGSHQSAIGVVRSPSLLNPEWEDLGPVVTSSDEGNYQTTVNAIDPALIEDEDGRVYMSYGSWFGGLALVEIDPATGMRLNPEEDPVKIFGGGHDSIEAPYIIREGDYYYLYYNYGTCCAGLDSTYEIRVTWSENIEGPYSADGYTILENDTGDRYVGPGHIGLLREGSCEYVTTHYYDRQSDGFPRVDLLALGYDSSDMPFLTRDFTPGECTDLQPAGSEEPAPEDEESGSDEGGTDDVSSDESAGSDNEGSDTGTSSGSGGGSFGFGLLLLLCLGGFARRKR
ncbi:arabinan endo-1,5-alpha-L-arabinosidase [Marinimicrobium sp. C2-29]|uniref:arabinan endo-1,5-alpha-L-arabinosidase n=1 Tax=Marinimicrobium sp. C2-29 TaxID=3139825 RepID=UPI0031389899